LTEIRTVALTAFQGLEEVLRGYQGRKSLTQGPTARKRGKIWAATPTKRVE